MITNREEVLENALRVFAKMNYEKASLLTIAKACGLSKPGLIYYYPFKQDLFVAVVDKYIFAMQDPAQKFSFEGSTLLEFIDHHVERVEKTMRRIVGLLDDGNNPQGCSYNFYYFHLLMQVRQYYPDARTKFIALFEKDRKLWRDIIDRAKSAGEIRAEVDTEEVVSMFREVFYGLSFEQAFLSGLDTEELSRKLRFIYSLIKA
ncbi:MAG TPA: TetR/AcrR family transcriptional regulator [Candidatus Bacteroides merdipullorum]|uniref:TetR/AcrR family transcriptional regulator n=1 Tax=Candidatus Bacteroides merdipullorum TaxID=2838474 RepID=A0A9D2CXW5_9BACE|nr:TetR/AcrR family transcriptional regulator [Candidatus Bacteroides merdipullorum]